MTNEFSLQEVRKEPSIWHYRKFLVAWEQTPNERRIGVDFNESRERWFAAGCPDNVNEFIVETATA
jgi:hypothetical protein